ncbi:C16orf70 [Symbiodinium sp. CCMP2592]|nr:C16orf70 [Symbiodinium sp. CCMP2592]
MGVNEALAIIQKMGSLDHAELSFHESCPFDADLTVRLPSWGIQLCFDAYQQDLRVITVRLQGDATEAKSGRPGAAGAAAGASGPEVPEGSLLPSLVYGGREFAAAGLAPSLREIYQMFGPTWIGDFRQQPEPLYLLQYPGLAFEFPLPQDLFEALAASNLATAE